MKESTLSNYGLIGDSCSAALVSSLGSIDWCCFPEFHSPPIFAALLDRQKGGYFSVNPCGRFQSTQKYLEDTNALETVFTTTEGIVELKDAFTAMSENEKMSSLFPDHEILRIVEGVAGKVRMAMEYSPRIYYGSEFPELKDNRKLGIQFSWKENIFILLSTLNQDQLKIEKVGSRVSAEFVVQPGEKIVFSLSYSSQSPAILPELKQTASHRMQTTISFWKDWIGKCQYSGVYQEEIKRSALALKLLAHAPTGAIIAAPTTSLPETIGGERNWDYRYCWLRDASFTTRALLKLGFEEEVHAYMNWILHATQLTRPEIKVVYSVYGHSRIKEETLDWLSGYKNSKPVRVGNKADIQFQLDVYGEILDAVYAYAPLIKEFDRNSRKFILGLGEVICKIWNRPDNGIWEIRSSDIHHTHSKVMAWVGLDRLVKLCTKYRWNEASRKKFQSMADLIRQQVEQFGYNIHLESYTREFSGTNLDASLLTLSLVGYCDYSSARMTSTVDLIYERLSNQNLIYRYRNISDGLKGKEGSFAICNFWLAENLARSGRIEEAIKVFETILKHSGPTGLLSEQIDPESSELLGNYPQAFTHIGLINAAISINEVLKKTI
jgi:GH15 family glucan-1,4-alpha-glucosidase